MRQTLFIRGGEGLFARRPRPTHKKKPNLLDGPNFIPPHCALQKWTSYQALFIRNSYQRGGGLGGSHKGATYSNLIFPQPIFGSR